MGRDGTQLWLVKSGGRILGPLSKGQVSDLLQSNEIVPIDEICEPMRRWQMIREHPDYVRVLDDMKTQNLNGFDNTTGAVTQTGSMTESIGDDGNEITEDISEFQKQLKEIVVDQVSESRSGMTPASVGRYQVVGHVDDSRLKMEAESNSRWLWLITLIVLAGVGLALYLKERNKSAQDKFHLPASELMQAAQLNYQNGDYVLALEYLKRVAEHESFRKDLPLPYGLLLLNIEGQTREARHWLKREPSRDGRPSLEALSGLAIADLMDGDAGSAEKMLNQVLEREPRFAPALMNLGAISLQQRNFIKAKDFLESALAAGGEYPVALIQLIEVYSSEARSSKSPNLKPIERRVADAYHSSFNYRQELGLGHLYLKMLSGSMGDRDGVIREILDIDPQQTDDHKQDLLVYKGFADWMHMYSWCEQIAGEAGNGPISKTLLSYCQLKQGRNLQARQGLEQAVNMSPKDPLIQAIYSYALRVGGLGSEASVALGRANEGDRRGEYYLPALLQARFCLEREDYDCARENFLKALQRDSKSLAARSGLAQIFLRKGMKAEANRYLRELENLSSTYKPLLRLKSRAGSLVD